MVYKYSLKFLIKAKISSFLFYFFISFIFFIVMLCLPWNKGEIFLKLIFTGVSLVFLRQAYLNSQFLQINGQELTQQFWFGQGQKKIYHTSDLQKIENSSPLFQAKYAYGARYQQTDLYSSTLYFKDGQKIYLYSSFENYSALLNYLRLDIENLNEEERYSLIDQIKEKIDTLFD